MKDFAGNELEVGMKVAMVMPGYKHLVWGTIIKINPQTATCHYEKWKGYEDDVVRNSAQLIAPMNPTLQDFIQAENLRANLTS